MARNLTVRERAAVVRVERALAAVPKTVTLFFNESGFDVIDSEIWREHGNRGGLWLEENSSDHRDIHCRYDTGAI